MIQLQQRPQQRPQKRPQKQRRKRLRESLKKQVAAGQRWQCGRCRGLLPSTYEINHVEPHCTTADDDPSNLVALCPNCHRWYTQVHAVWLTRHRMMRAARPSDWLCIGCHDVVSTYFLKSHTRACRRPFTTALFPCRAPPEAFLPDDDGR